MKLLIALLFLLSVSFADDLTLTASSGCADNAIFATTNFIFTSANTFADLSACLVAQSTKTTLTTMTMQGLDTITADAFSITWTGYSALVNIDFDFSDLGLTQGSDVDTILTSITDLHAISTLTSVTVNLEGSNVAGASSTNVEAVAALGTIDVNDYGFSCELDSDNDSMIACQTVIITDVSASICTAANSAITDVTFTTTTNDLQYLVECLENMTGLETATINLAGSSLGDVDISDLAASVTSLTLDVSNSSLSASRITDLFDYITVLQQASPSVFVTLAMTVQTESDSTNTVDFSVITAAHTLAALFTTADITFWDDVASPAAACVIDEASGTTAVCTNYPTTFSLDIDESMADAGSTSMAYLVCTDSEVTVSAGSTWTNNLAASDPTFSSDATYAWAVNTAGTDSTPDTETHVVDFSALSDTNTVVLSVVVTDGSNTYNSEEITLTAETCVPTATLTITGAEGDTDIETCEDVTVTLNFSNLSDSDETVSAITWEIEDASGNSVVGSNDVNVDSFVFVSGTVADDDIGTYTVSVTSITMNNNDTVTVTDADFDFVVCNESDDTDTTTTTDDEDDSSLIL